MLTPRHRTAVFIAMNVPSNMRLSMAMAISVAPLLVAVCQASDPYVTLYVVATVGPSRQ